MVFSIQPLIPYLSPSPTVGAQDLVMRMDAEQLRVALPLLELDTPSLAWRLSQLAEAGVRVGEVLPSLGLAADALARILPQLNLPKCAQNHALLDSDRCIFPRWLRTFSNARRCCFQRLALTIRALLPTRTCPRFASGER